MEWLLQISICLALVHDKRVNYILVSNYSSLWNLD